MADSKLAGLYVEFSTKGWEAVQGILGKVVVTLDKATAAAGRVAGGIGSIVGASYALVASGGALGAFFGQISHGTVEGERMGRAFEYLKRVVVDSFAPYVRQLTDSVM